MLFFAAHVHEEPSGRPEDLLANPSLARYVMNFGRVGDLGVIAEGAGEPIGAAWVRLLAGDNRGYGWVDDSIPELAIAVTPAWASCGVGTQMMRELLALARDRYPGVSLSVRVDNAARRLYSRLGFEAIAVAVNRVGGTSDTMLLRFG
jgi:ribosomal protein S18 acetylase RimI-like enzyme